MDGRSRGILGGAMLRALCLLVPVLLPAGLAAQTPEPLTLPEAIRLAATKNGTIRAAVIDARTAKIRTEEARAAFFPVVTPFYQYNSSRSVGLGTTSGHVIQSDGSSTGVSTSFPILDTGQRQLGLLSASRSEASARANSLQTLRATLFTVHQQYYEALRAQELLRVAQAQVDRTKLILDQTNARVDAGDAPKKDVLQAKSDYLNASVDAIAQKNASSNANATLKATLGLDLTASLPPLVKPEDPTSMASEADVEGVVKEGLANRADLTAQRRTVDASRYDARRLGLEAGPTFNLDASFDLAFSPRHSQNRTLGFVLSAPLFDGGLRRAQARVARYQLERLQILLLQSERNARAEIESAVAEYNQNAERVNAAKAALDAAKENYQAAVDAQKLGAASVIEVSTAQVTLVTAESNYIQAIYDYDTSEVRLRLVAGRPVPGEELANLKS